MPKSAKISAKPPVGSSSRFMSPIKKVIKRDGSVVDFDLERISNAVYKAMASTGEGDRKEADFIARKVNSELVRVSKLVKNFVPTVEGIQDIVEKELMLEDFVKTSKAYILYREERSRLRREMGEIPDKVRNLVNESKKYFRNSLSEFVYYRTYSKWIDAEGRRETWIETVDRYMDFMKENAGKKFTDKEYSDLRQAILKMEMMPSMRLMWGAGSAARKTNVVAYNCSFIAPKAFQDFGEIMYVLMCGTGAGYSVESQNIQQLPIVKQQTGKILPTHVIADSREGWADALVAGMKAWYEGKDIKFDYSQIRPRGSRLKTMGGKSSGPESLIDLLNFTRALILKRQGRRISNLDAHDLICKIGEVVVAGGVRRSALISLSDLDDELMRHAKEGHFYITDPQRSMANNSAVYRGKPDSEEFLAEWMALVKSKSGERGIFNRGSLKEQMPERRWKLHANPDEEQWGTNPCGEITLRSKQFCNLTEVVARANDTEQSLLRKVRLATMLGTYQSTLTNFGYLSKEWKENCEADRLLGVSITGQWDSKAVRSADMLKKMREEAIKVNREYAKRLKINPSSSITCIKPSGTVSQMVDASSGMHPRHAKFYIRRIRIGATDSLFKMLKDQGLSYFPEVGQTYDTATTFVFEFPVRAPGGSIFKDDLSALEQLEYWRTVKVNFTEHNPSVTISVGDNEWLAVANWIYENWDLVGGLSFLPRDNHVYQLAPYEAIDEERYNRMLKRFETIDYSKIVTYEKIDETQGAKELACVSGVCEI